jgi:ribonuclease Z
MPIPFKVKSYVDLISLKGHLLFEIVFLGTSASAPSVRRGLSAQVVKHNEHRFLIDCGEGTQRQILKSGIGFKKLDKILITHGHLDHILGLAGLASTFSRWDTLEQIEIMGGKYALDRIHTLLYDLHIVHPTKSQIELVFREIGPGVIFEDDGLSVTAFSVTHRGPDCFGFLFEEKARRPFLPEKAEALGIPIGPIRGRLTGGEAVTLDDGRVIQPEEVLGEEIAGTKFVHVGDAGRIDDLMAVCQGADTLVIEATYLKEDQEMANNFAHLTAEMAATLAKEARVKNLILTHVSRRYRERDIRNEAQAVFENARIARDFDVYMVKRGELVKLDS